MLLFKFPFYLPILKCILKNWTLIIQFTIMWYFLILSFNFRIFFSIFFKNIINIVTLHKIKLLMMHWFIKKKNSQEGVMCYETFDQIFCMLNQMQEEPDEDSQCLSDDTDTEISTQVGTPPNPTVLWIHLVILVH